MSLIFINIDDHCDKFAFDKFKLFLKKYCLVMFNYYIADLYK